MEEYKKTLQEKNNKTLDTKEVNFFDKHLAKILLILFISIQIIYIILYGNVEF